jgi:hypothetical protein
MPALQNKPKLSRLLLAGAVVAAWALGGQVFCAGQSLAPPVPPTARETLYLTGGYVELRSLLRGKLPGSVDDVLAGLAAIAQNRPGMAIDLAKDLGRTQAEKAAWVGEIMKPWAGRDPAHAWDWLAQQTYLTNDQVANAGLAGVVIEAMAMADPKMLVKKVDSLLHQDNSSPGPLSAQGSLYMGLQALINHGQVDLAQTAVETWARDPLQPKIGATAYEFIAMALNKNSPESAATWLRSLPVSDDRNSAAGTYASFWGQSDPAAAMRWAETFAPQEGQPEAISQIFNEWMQKDAAGAMHWLGQSTSRHPAFVESDLMIGSQVLFSPATKDDPPKALKLADTIANPQTRLIYQQQVYQSWGRRDPAAAIAYVQKSPAIAPEQKQTLIQQIQAASSPNQSEQ